jgi:hypothetical protein
VNSEEGMDAEEQALLVDEILESEEAFLVIAALLEGPRSLDQLADTTGLDLDLVAHVIGTMAEMDLVRPSRASGARFAIAWKPMTRLIVDAAVGMDTEVSIMVEAHGESSGEAFESFAALAGDRVASFEKELASNPEFTALVKDYLQLLVREYLADDPRLYDTTLLDAAVAFESLLAKVGPDAFKTRSSRSARLLGSLRRWAGYVSDVNMLGEVALAETLDGRGLLRR